MDVDAYQVSSGQLKLVVIGICGSRRCCGLERYWTGRQLVEASLAVAAVSLGSVSPVSVPPVRGAPEFSSHNPSAYVPV